MCGITGVFAYGASSLRLDAGTLDRMTDSLAHRGPDDRGTHLDPGARVGLGHRRLSIIDLSAAGHQPMPNDDGSCWIVYNGEVYNHAEIRRELEAKGVRFRSRSDTEAILRLYEAVGEGCVERLNGMFAFAIFDAREGTLFLARDRIGVKPLYWADVGGHLVFGSEARALLLHPLVTRELDRASFYHNLTFLSTPAPATMYRGIQRLSPGHVMTVDRRGVRTRRYWDALDAPRLGAEEVADEAAVAGEIRTRLKNAVRDRMMSDVPFGVFLSGGIDSSANVALMAECSSLPVETFTVGYQGQGVDHLNELHHARRVAERYGTHHHEVVIDHRSVLDYLPGFVEHQDEPVFDPVCVPLYYVSKLARDSGIKVIQVGEGSDELFMGYGSYLDSIRYARRLAGMSKLPRALRAGLFAAASPVLRGIPGLLGVGGRLINWEEVLRRSVDEDVFWGGAILLGDREKAALVPGSAGASSWSVVAPFHEEIERRWPEADRAQRMSYVELRQRLPELLLQRVDKITMSVSLEGREPFLDYPLVEYVLRLPMHYKVGAGDTTKRILKRAIGDLLPDDLVHRRKQGFPAPMSQWVMEESFGRFVRETLRDSALVRDGVLDAGGVQRIAEEHFSRRRDRGALLWTLFNLTLWYRRWIRGEPSIG
jgi:asparagine synthase (glutamine-hydrolysing)